LHAPVQLSRLAHARMKKKGDGCIIMNTSIHGTLSVEWMTAYAASKAALDHMTRGMSNEWASDGIRVNAVAPGIVPVERTEKILHEKSAQDLWLPHLPAGTLTDVQRCEFNLHFLSFLVFHRTDGNSYGYSRCSHLFMYC